ncbi:MAG: outer membrane beta-barrel protein [Bacteroidales bacterium]
MRNIAIGIAACLLQACLCGQLSAQVPDETVPENARRAGPVRFLPAIVFAGPGVDTNVFDQYDQPRQDWTARVAPKSDWWMRMGRGSLTAYTTLEYVHFAKYESQRSLNGEVKAKLAVSLGHFIPYLSAGYLSTRDRPGYEIDVRARRIEDGAAVGSDFRISSRMTIGAWGSRSQLRYDEADQFLGTSLARALNRVTTGWHAEARRRVMSLTTVLVRAEGLQDRFDTSHYKDADSVSVKPGIQFKPAALLKGEALVGYRSFRPLNPLVPEFKGLVASLELAWVHSATRIGVRMSRDIEYSFVPTEPYYLLTDIAPIITQMITRNWDVSAGAAWQRLAYEVLATPGGTTLPGAGRTDKGFRAAAGFGRSFGDTLRIGFEASYYERRSLYPGLASYEKLLAGVSVRYGLKP